MPSQWLGVGEGMRSQWRGPPPLEQIDAMTSVWSFEKFSYTGAVSYPPSNSPLRLLKK
uniref:Uncharacterized protein n=1 Tax=Physcomitrium patens TaxID=3218 RepID=A0A2K1L1S6_PHYPA|nr:hypothetical protein PHYPA_002765 [Physcomitrium patens]